LYRDEVYNPATERPGEADVILAKHRNGPTGAATLLYRKEQTQFVNMRRQRIDLSTGGVSDPWRVYQPRQDKGAAK